MFNATLFLFCVWTCYGLPIDTANTSILKNPLANCSTSVEFVDQLPPYLQKGIVESNRMQDANATNEEIMQYMEKYISEHGSHQESEEAFLKLFAALLDYSEWTREITEKQGPQVQKFLIYVAKRSEGNRYSAISQEEEENENNRPSMVFLGIRDISEVTKLHLQAQMKANELRLNELAQEYRKQVQKESDSGIGKDSFEDEANDLEVK